MNTATQSKLILHLKRLAASALFLALCMVLPFLTGQVPSIGNMLCPMHLPVLICGMVCGSVWGGAVGFIAPLLRFALFSMPPIYPQGISMSFELLTYGLIAGIMIKLLPKKLPYTYLSLIVAMLSGRVVWGVVRTLITLFGGTPFTFTLFLADGFVSAIPGIIIQLIAIPPIVAAFEKSKLLLN